MRIKHYFSLLCIALLFVACTAKAPVTNRSQIILLPLSYEMALGEQSYKEALSKSKIIIGTKDAKRVKTIGNRIAKVVNNDYKWEFNLVDNKAKNAFCLPGGKVVVFTGILEVAKNDDQLATVMSHEIAHALARHGGEKMTTSYGLLGLQILGTLAFKEYAPQFTSTFNQVYGVGSEYFVKLPYGRMQESEADEIGIHLMYKAGYDMKEALKFWENMSDGKKESIEFFSTHPNSSTRIANITKIISEIEYKKE